MALSREQVANYLVSPSKLNPNVSAVDFHTSKNARTFPLGANLQTLTEYDVACGEITDAMAKTLKDSPINGICLVGSFPGRPFAAELAEAMEISGFATPLLPLYGDVSVIHATKLDLFRANPTCALIMDAAHNPSLLAEKIRALRQRTNLPLDPRVVLALIDVESPEVDQLKSVGVAYKSLTGASAVINILSQKLGEDRIANVRMQFIHGFLGLNSD